MIGGAFAIPISLFWMGWTSHVSSLIVQFLISPRLSPAVVPMNNVVTFDQYLVPNTRLRPVRLWYTVYSFLRTTLVF
jgi:hypothetical protein